MISLCAGVGMMVLKETVLYHDWTWFAKNDSSVFSLKHDDTIADVDRTGPYEPTN